ncbi:CAP domain-containing protein [Oceanobacillus bengalensis]|uniref:SCP domain-containing protein n=1 Tax=Oceanobacillus bengalensis TaxID=1435466 RepID=A0A494YWJ4_9BACI|nr:CAP domain-containing protein [Oceanobacillus bengalensis]RKQ14392.1 hypothetical protein D8M05_13270 [Oceanobacillus bengalensis]
MLKKIGMVTALSTALIFGGAFQSADASADVNHSDVSYKIYYSINGENGNFSSGNIDDDKIYNLVNQIMNRYQIDWKNPFSEQLTEQAVPNEQKEEKVENPVEKETVVEEPVKQKPVEEIPVVEKPVEQPKAEAPVQQPVQEKTEPTEKNQQVSQLSQFEQEVVELTNQERAKYGLSALEIDTELSKVAREKSNDMAVNNYFDHNSPVYGSPFDMMQSFGISYNTAGENIAKGQRTPAEVVNAWMNSEGHRANILNGNFTHIGVGYVENGNIWTQQFIGK